MYISLGARSRAITRHGFLLRDNPSSWFRVIILQNGYILLDMFYVLLKIKEHLKPAPAAEWFLRDSAFHKGR